MIPFIILLAFFAALFIALVIKYRKLAKRVEYAIDEERCRRKQLEQWCEQMHQDFELHCYKYH